MLVFLLWTVVNRCAFPANKHVVQTTNPHPQQIEQVELELIIGSTCVVMAVPCWWKCWRRGNARSWQSPPTQNPFHPRRTPRHRAVHRPHPSRDESARNCVKTDDHTNLRPFTLCSHHRSRCHKKQNKKLSYHRDSARCGWNGHSRSPKVIQGDCCCANQPPPSSVLEISRPVCTSIPLSGGTGKRRLGVDGHALVSWCPEHWTIQPQT